MKLYLILPLILLSCSAFAAINHDIYAPVAWQELKVENPEIKDVFVNVNSHVEQQDVVIPAFVVKSWMKTDENQPIYFLSTQPYVCEHSQPPYANQMIKIDNIPNLPLSADNAIPVYAFGNISIDANKADMFSSAYTIELHDILPYKAENPAESQALAQ
mgnify:CR=1 FL=1